LGDPERERGICFVIEGVDWGFHRATQPGVVIIENGDIRGCARREASVSTFARAMARDSDVFGVEVPCH
jgi:hypothetical protein